ncbi:MAG: hypothetical protein JNK16_00925 [Phycisphaerales bacterium]|nr:hypothetical protein [Phycisphaerales bacterium]
MRALFSILAFLVAGGCANDSIESDRSAFATPAKYPAVCRLQSPQIAGSLIPIGDQRAVTARHLLRQPVVRVDGKLTGVDSLENGLGAEVSAGDWVVLQVNDTPLPEPDALVEDYAFRDGSLVFLSGFASAVGSSSGPSLVHAEVQRPPFWVPTESGIVYLRVEGSPDLSGMSGGPVVIPDDDGTGWRVVGLYLGRWQSAGWTGYVVRPLPIEIFARTESNGVKEQAKPD